MPDVNKPADPYILGLGGEPTNGSPLSTPPTQWRSCMCVPSGSATVKGDLIPKCDCAEGHCQMDRSA